MPTGGRARNRRDVLVPLSFGATVPTPAGEFRAASYQSQTGSEHLALFIGMIRGARDVLTRLHSGCLTGDVVGSLRCDCGVQLRESMSQIAEEGLGVLIYNPSHEGRGIGLLEKLRAYRLQDDGLDTVDSNVALGHLPDSRDYSIEAEILRDLGTKSIRLLTNNPHKMVELEGLGIEVSGRVPMRGLLSRHNQAYLAAKTSKLGHWPDAFD